jgi:ribosome maturation factor RimP
MAALVEKIEVLIKPSVEDLGFELVQVRFMEGKSSRLLQIMAERPDGTITIDDCTLISRQLSAVLDVADIMPAAYRLEISSPGIDRPLVKRKDYEDYLGHSAKIESILPIDGRKRWTGILKTLIGETLTLEVDGKPVAIELNDIQSAKLVLTDELIKQHMKKQAS